jgi:hypothetical protein
MTGHCECRCDALAKYNTAIQELRDLRACMESEGALYVSLDRVRALLAKYDSE